MKKLVVPLIILCLAPVFVAVPALADQIEVPLVAGGGNPASAITVGVVRVWNDCDYLYVEFDTTDSGECMTETHVHVATSMEDIPQTKTGNPIPGQFEWSEPHGCVLEKTYTIPLTGDPGDELYIAAHAALGQEEAMSFESNIGDAVYGPINSDSEPIEWGDPGSAVRAYNWLGYTRDLADPDQIPGCTTNPLSSLSWSWGFGLNPTYSPDIPGVLWISTAPNTEEWHVDSWRKFVESYEVPGYPIAGSLEVNADNYYVVSNGETIGSDDNIFNGPETYTFYPVEGLNTLEFITENLAQGSETNHCDQLRNPNGVTYKATVTYYADGETAWGCCDPFPGKNWATYFSYEVQDCITAVRYPETGNVYIGYEDWPDGDFDYNDFGMTFEVEETYERIVADDYLVGVKMTFTAVIYDSGMEHLIHIQRPIVGSSQVTVTRPNPIPSPGPILGKDETPAGGPYTFSGTVDVILFNTSKYTWPQKQIGEVVIVEIAVDAPTSNPRDPALVPPRVFINEAPDPFYDMDAIMANYDPWEEGTLYGSLFHIHNIQSTFKFGSPAIDVPYILVVPYPDWIPPWESTIITSPYGYFDDFYRYGSPENWYDPSMVTNNTVGSGGLSWGPYPSP